MDDEAQAGLVRAVVVAELLGVPVGTVHQLVHQRRIPHVRLGRRFIRFRRAEIETWLQQHAVAPGVSR